MGSGSIRMGSGGVCVDDGIGRGLGQGGWDREGTGSTRDGIRLSQRGWDQAGSWSTRMESGGVWVNDRIGRGLRGMGLGRNWVNEDGIGWGLCR